LLVGDMQEDNMASRMLSLDQVTCSDISKEHTRYTALCIQHYWILCTLYSHLSFLLPVI